MIMMSFELALDLLVLAPGVDGVALGAGLGEDLLPVIGRHVSEKCQTF